MKLIEKIIYGSVVALMVYILAANVNLHGLDVLLDTTFVGIFVFGGVCFTLMAYGLITKLPAYLVDENYVDPLEKKNV